MRVVIAYSRILLSTPQAINDKQQIVDFVKNYSDLDPPKTLKEIYQEILSAFPGNVYCQAGDRLSITSTISNLFKQNSKLKLLAKKKKGGVWTWNGPAKKPVVSPRKELVNKTDAVSTYATKEDVNRIEAMMTNFIQTLKAQSV